ncbi:MAG: DASH complex subunit dam1 [Heterodermia speciosa]|uniref:DASH complex subunit DAM1 n=1 Tax=Heterodermia speciosa TaxID=116794 RepID=A0A8H3FAU8_9LECA|nr:MAG: DASH complex subunit dam1 [Heterodermia speciosa]
MDSSGNKRSTSQSRNRPSSRPTTPLRPSSRTSLRESQGFAAGAGSSEFPLESLEPAFAELSDSMADLEANFMHLQLMHESLSRFNESFASFLYGMNMNAFCVDFPEAPIADSFTRPRSNTEHPGPQSSDPENLRQSLDGETTFMTTDTSFVENPPSSKSASRFTNAAPAPRVPSGPNKRGGTDGAGAGRGSFVRGSGRGIRGSGLARAKPRGAR